MVLLKNKFVTLFARTSNTELTKDIGMIPFLLHKDHKFCCKIACYQNQDEYPALKEEVKGLELDFITRRFKREWLDGALYLYKNAKEIDILNIYHLDTKRLALWWFIYKILNPKGIIYLKLDLSCTGPDLLKKENWLIMVIRKYVLQRIDLISAESHRLCMEFKKIYGVEACFIPNGYYDWYKPKTVKDKERIILTVGRIGTNQKATEILLEAFADIASKTDYLLKLVGKVDERFQAYIKQFYEKHEELRERVIFTGEIYSKYLLALEYEKAQIFVLPSRWESFGIVVPEAMSLGCYPIVSDSVAPCAEFTDNLRLGKNFVTDNIKSLEGEIMKAINELKVDKTLPDNIKEYAKQQFYWKLIVDRISGLLIDKIIERKR